MSFVLAAAVLSFAQALGVECAYCHVEGDWHNSANPPFAIAARMTQMVGTLNSGLLSGTSGVECWTCHSGQKAPARLPAAAWRAIQEKWPASLPDSSDRVKLAMSVYSASLGVGCEYCHAADDWQSNGKPAFRMVARMNELFDVFPQFMPSTARTQCYMCHKGATSPSRRTP